MFVGLSSCNGNVASSVLVFEAQQIQLTTPMDVVRWTSRYVAILVASGACHKPQEATTTTKATITKRKKFWHSCQSLSIPVSVSVSIEWELSLYLCCVCLSKTGHTMLIVAFVAVTFVVVTFVVVLCWRLQCNKSVLTHLFSNFFCYYFRHQQRIFAFVRQL